MGAGKAVGSAKKNDEFAQKYHIFAAKAKAKMVHVAATDCRGNHAGMNRQDGN
jgi:hypothetical protein